MKVSFKELVQLIFGTFLVAVGVYFFKFPNNFSTGGESGLAIILSKIVPAITPGTFVLIINGIFLIMGFILLNKDFGIKTVFCCVLLSLMIRFFEILIPLERPLTDQKLLELVYSVIFPAVGSAIVFNIDASTGGTDIPAMILKKYTSINIGRAILCIDFLTASAAMMFFGLETGLYSILGVIMKSLIIDYVIESINLKKSFTIVTKYPDEICDYINNTLHRGATVWEAKGSFTREGNYVIMTALSRFQANSLRIFVKKTDPQGFMVITNTSNIIGNGFLSE